MVICGFFVAIITGKFTIFCQVGAMSSRHQRNAVAIDVEVSSVLDRAGTRIIDLSEHGALLIGATLPERSRCQIHYQGQIVYGIVMWAEIDRMGIRFPYELLEGPLHNTLEAARDSWRTPPSQIFLSSPQARFGRRGSA